LDDDDDDARWAGDEHSDNADNSAWSLEEVDLRVTMMTVHHRQTIVIWMTMTTKRIHTISLILSN